MVVPPTTILCERDSCQHRSFELAGREVKFKPIVEIISVQIKVDQINREMGLYEKWGSPGDLTGEYAV